MNATLQTVNTPDGPFMILADADGAVLSSGWTADADAILNRLRPAYRPAEVDVGYTVAAAAVEAFYGGDVRALDKVLVRQHGTVMQVAGWKALRGIEPGHPLSYTEFATELGTPTAVRAAASICARNAPALFVPCHRVLRGDGTLGGFAWGVDVKRSLLAREAAAL